MGVEVSQCRLAMNVRRPNTGLDAPSKSVSACRSLATKAIDGRSYQMSIQSQGAATPTFTVVSERKPSFTIRFGKWVAGNAHVVLAFMVFFVPWEAAVDRKSVV